MASYPTLIFQSEKLCIINYDGYMHVRRFVPCMKNFLLEMMPHVKHVIYHSLALSREFLPNDFGNDIKVKYIAGREKSEYLDLLKMVTYGVPTLIVLEIYYGEKTCNIQVKLFHSFC